MGTEADPKHSPTATGEVEDSEVLEIFRSSGAFLAGHFVLRSGHHSRYFFQCARVGEDLRAVERLAGLLMAKLPEDNFETVVSPAMGGLVFGQEVARQAGKRFIFLEKVDGRLALRRGFRIAPGERILVVEDVITRGGRVQETLDIIKNHGGSSRGVAVMVDRSGGKATFGVPLISLLAMTFPTYPPDDLPADLKGIPAENPGS